jgi:hypothetical protein
VNLARAQFFATRAHRGQLQSTGEPLIAHVRRVAAGTPQFARPMAWLHEVLEWTSVSEEELLAEGVSDEELRALRLLTRAVNRGSESGYMAHITMIARAEGPAGVLARAVKVADLGDRLRNPSMSANGSPLPYRRALRIIMDAEGPSGDQAPRGSRFARAPRGLRQLPGRV